MRAEDARIITANNETFRLSLWWRDYKDELFEAIKISALMGNYNLVIGVSGTLNKDNWILNKKYRKLIDEELSELGYKTSYIDHSQAFQISWGD
jgi:hypothetical protein